MMVVGARRLRELEREGKGKALDRHRVELIRMKVCAGCHHDFYNWPRDADNRGVAVEEGYHCWHMMDVDLRRRQPCRSYTRRR